MQSCDVRTFPFRVEQLPIVHVLGITSSFRSLHAVEWALLFRSERASWWFIVRQTGITAIFPCRSTSLIRWSCVSQKVDRQIVLKYCLIINFMLGGGKIADGCNTGVVFTPVSRDMVFKLYDGWVGSGRGNGCEPTVARVSQWEQKPMKTIINQTDIFPC